MAPIRDLATTFSALSDATRLRILGLLADGEICVCDIHKSLRLPQPTVSRHLAYLRRARLVESRRDGLWMHYRLAQPNDRSLRAALSAAVHAVGHAPATRADRQRLDACLRRDARSTKPLPVVSCCGMGPDPNAPGLEERAE